MPTDRGGVLAGATWAATAVAVGTSGLLALVRLTDPTSRRLIELVTLVPLGLPLAVLGALMALGLVAVGRRRRGPMVALVVALALAAGHAAWVAPLYVGGRTSTDAASLVVLTQNWEYGDADSLAAAARDHDVDVLVLLEVSPEHLAQLLATGIGTRLPHSTGLEDAQGMGTVVLSRIPVAGAVPLYDGAESRVVELVDDRLGPVTVVAVHTRPPYTPELWRADHERTFAGLALLRDDISTDIILAGDFNATLAHAPMRHILGLGFDDAADQVNSGLSPTWPTGGHERRLGITVPAFAAIDHVLTSPGLAVSRAATLDIAGTDHKAVLATIFVRG